MRYLMSKCSKNIFYRHCRYLYVLSIRRLIINKNCLTGLRKIRMSTEETRDWSFNASAGASDWLLGLVYVTTAAPGRRESPCLVAHDAQSRATFARSVRRQLRESEARRLFARMRILVDQIAIHKRARISSKCDRAILPVL